MRRKFFHKPDSSPSVAAVLFFVSLLVSPLLLAQETPPSSPTAKPAARLDLSALGYRAPSRADRLTEDESSVSLNFVDATHVLLTFNRKKLLQRLPGCPPDHQDRLMHAAILEIPSGKVVTQVDWYLHDRRRYLWPLGQGKFLLRKWNDLFLLDSSLHETLLMSSPKDLLWVTVTPDASQIVVETAAAATPAKDSPTGSTATSPAKHESKFVLQFLDAKTLALQRTVALDQVVNLSGTNAGYADLVRKGDIWLIRFGPSPKRRRNVARVRSQTVPDVFYSSNNSLLVGRCAAHDCDYSVTAFTLSGHRLWQQHWPRYRTYPAVVRDEDHRRFGVSTLQLAAVTPEVKVGNALDQDDINQPDISRTDVFQQQIQIFETASGTPVLSVDVTPGVLSGQNFSLSPDGRHLAVLQRASIELFDLPPASEEEQSRFSALKSDVSDLYTLASSPDSPSSSPDADSSANANPATAPAADNPSPAVTANNSTSLGDAGNPNNPSAPAEAKNDSNASATNASAKATPANDASANAASANAASANAASANDDPVATIRISAKSVVVDVVVTDSKGHPVKGLPLRDFQLAEDGKPQDIRAFREFSDPDEPSSTAASPPAPATQPPPPAQPAKPSPNVFSNNARTAEPGAVTMILFDLLNTPSQDQVYARQQLIKFLQSKPKNSQLALCTLSNGAARLRLIQGFTADETLLLAAAKGKKAAPKNVRWQVSAAGTENSVDTVGTLAQGGPTSGFQGLLSALQGMQAEQQVTDTDERAAITLDSMMLLSRYLSGIPGRKNVVWLSGSFPISIAGASNAGNLSVDNPNYSYKIKLVTNLLAEAQVAVYPVDVRGLLGAGLSADNAGGMGGPTSFDQPDFSASSVISPTPAVPQDLQALAQQATERDTLTAFATATGGKAFYNSNGIREAIEIAVQQGSNYYTLAYSPANKIYDGKYRKIKIALAAKGFTLHYRQGYFAEDSRTASKDAELARRTRAVAMQHGSPPARQLLFSARVVPVGGKKKIERAKLGDVLTPSKTADPTAPVALIEVQHYSIDYTFAGSELRFIPLPNDEYRNELMLMATSFDNQGRMLSGMSNVGTSDLQPDLYRKVITGDFGVHQEADVPMEAASLRLGIQDQMNNHLGTVEIPLPVPAAPDSARRVRAPLPDVEPD